MVVAEHVSYHRPADQPRRQTSAADADGLLPRQEDGLPALTFGLPHRNHHFKGREEELEELHRRLAGNTEEPVAIQALAATGGIGKSELAREYAYVHASRYQCIAWLRAETVEELQADLAGLGVLLRLASQEEAAAQPAEVAERTVQLLNQSAGWLLIFDNAPELAGLQVEALTLENYLPRVHQSAHVVLTTRSQSWSHLAQLYELGLMSLEDARKLFLDDPESINSKTLIVLDELCTDLGFLPLALAQASAYIQRSGCGIQGYSDLWKERRSELLAKDSLRGQSQSVATTWDLSFQLLEANSPDGAALLKLCSYLAPEDIPHSLLVEGAEHWPSPLNEAAKDSLRLRGALAAARELSLLRFERGESEGQVRTSYAIHRLVQEVMRFRLGAIQEDDWLRAAIRGLNATLGYEREDHSTWLRVMRWAPHIAAVVDAEEVIDTEQLSIDYRLLFNKTETCLQRLGSLWTARRYMAKSLTLAIRRCGEDSSEASTDRNNLGMTLKKDLGDLEGARREAERALAIVQQVYGGPHPEVAIHANSLGLILKDLGDLEGACREVERALAITQRVYDEDHRVVAIHANNLGMILQDLGDLDGARREVERALAIAQQVYDDDHPVVAIHANNLGMILQDLGDLDGARREVERALAIAQQVYGDDHSVVARNVNDLVVIFQDQRGQADQEDQGRARWEMERALAITQQIYGERHSLVATYLHNLSGVVVELGQVGAAIQYVTKALQIRQVTFGDEHRLTISSREHLERLKRLEAPYES
ncbi:MAG: tetratricopeptide repeat protein [Acidobacteriota bacterium]